MSASVYGMAQWHLVLVLSLMVLPFGCGRGNGRCADGRKLVTETAARLLSAGEDWSNPSDLARLLGAALSEVEDGDARLAAARELEDMLLADRKDGEDWLDWAESNDRRFVMLNALAQSLWETTGDADRVCALWERQRVWCAKISGGFSDEKRRLAKDAKHWRKTSLEMSVMLATRPITDLTDEETRLLGLSRERTAAIGGEIKRRNRLCERFNGWRHDTFRKELADRISKSLRERAGDEAAAAMSRRMEKLIMWDESWNAEIWPTGLYNII